MKDKINIGMVGMNFGLNVAMNQIRNGSAGDFFNLKAICDADPERLKCAQDELAVSETFDDFEFGRGAAISYMLTSFVFVISIAQIRLLQREIDY